MLDDPGATAWIDLVLSKAGELRAAGVLSIQFDGRGATFSEAVTLPVGDIEKSELPDELVGDALNDPATYPGGIVPGFKIQKLEPEE